jgi:hypothetical protein
MDSILKNYSRYLEYIIDNELIVSCPLLPTENFIKYCKARDIKTSKEQLERLEKLKLFYPIARFSYEGIGETSIVFKKENMKKWFKEGHLWHPASRDFEEWKTFCDEDGDKKIDSFYSIFQSYSLYDLIESTKFELSALWFDYYNEKNLNEIKNHLKSRIDIYKENTTPYICQIISNRYYPKTRTDRRLIVVPGNSNDPKWDWFEYCRNWDAKKIFNDMNIPIEEIKNQQEFLFTKAQCLDPLEFWYDLVRFVSINEKDKLKGKALFAQTLYSMEYMLRLFYKEKTGEELNSPDERKSLIYGDYVTKDELKYLAFLANEYHLNPKPKLILVVEGKGELEQFPKLSKKLFHASFPKFGIEIISIDGIGNFTGKKTSDKYGALKEFIDYHHDKQTIVFIVLDDEGRASEVKERLLNAKSKYFSGRYVTKAEYIHLWEKKTIEFTNFTTEEIAKAMTKCGGNRYEFQIPEIANCEKESENKKNDALSELFNKKLDRELQKTKLLEILFDFITSNPGKEFDQDGNAKRPVVKMIKKILELANMNHQPTTKELWKKNQETGFYGRKY